MDRKVCRHPSPSLTFPFTPTCHLLKGWSHQTNKWEEEKTHNIKVTACLAPFLHLPGYQERAECWHAIFPHHTLGTRMGEKRSICNRGLIRRSPRAKVKILQINKSGHFRRHVNLPFPFNEFGDLPRLPRAHAELLSLIWFLKSLVIGSWVFFCHLRFSERSGRQECQVVKSSEKQSLSSLGGPTGKLLNIAYSQGDGLSNGSLTFHLYSREIPLQWALWNGLKFEPSPAQCSHFCGMEHLEI